MTESKHQFLAINGTDRGTILINLCNVEAIFCKSLSPDIIRVTVTYPTNNGPMRNITFCVNEKDAKWLIHQLSCTLEPFEATNQDAGVRLGR